MARAASSPLVTRTLVSQGLTDAKFAALTDMARRAGWVRQEAWRRYGAIAGLARTTNQIRDEDWMGPGGLGARSGLPARVWKAVLKDALGDIAASHAAAMKAVTTIVWRSSRSQDEKIRLSRLLQTGAWPQDRLLHRLMRKHWGRGRSSVANQVVFDVQCHRSFTHGGRYWIAVTSMVPGRRIAIPLDRVKDTGHRPAITGEIRVVLREDGEVAVHHTVPEADACVHRPCGTAVLGLDKGYTEVFTDSTGVRHGDGLGTLLSADSDRRKALWAQRQKIAAVAARHRAAGRHAKAERMHRHNLGRKKVQAQKRRHRQLVRTLVYRACHSVFDAAARVRVEDLTRPIVGYDRGRDMNRRLTAWVKGLIQAGVENTSRRRGASVDVVNAAYTSQWLPGCNAFGRRSRDAIHCPLGRDGAVFDADHVAAVNILERGPACAGVEDGAGGVAGLDRFLPHKQVRRLLEDISRRTERPCTTSGACGVRSCLRLPRQDSSCSAGDGTCTINGERIIAMRTIEYVE